MAATDFSSWLSQILGLNGTAIPGAPVDPMQRLPAELQFANFSDALNYQLSSNTAMSEDAWNTFKTQYWPTQENLLKTMGGQGDQPGVPGTVSDYFSQALKPQNVNRAMGIAESDTKQAYDDASGEGRRQFVATGGNAGDRNFMSSIADSGIEQARDIARGRTSARKTAEAGRLANLQNAVTTGYQGLQTVISPEKAASSFSNIASGGAASGSNADARLAADKAERKAADKSGLESLVMKAAMLAAFG